MVKASEEDTNTIVNSLCRCLKISIELLFYTFQKRLIFYTIANCKFNKNICEMQHEIHIKCNNSSAISIAEI